MRVPRSFCLSLPLFFSLSLTTASWAGDSQIVTPGRVIGWGDNFYRQSSAPANLTNAIQVSGGNEFSLALRDTFVVTSIPGDSRISENALSIARAVAAGYQTAVSIRPDGGVNLSTYIDEDYHPFPLWSPAPKTVAVTMATENTLAVQEDGTVTTGGTDIICCDVSPLPGVSNIVAVSGSDRHFVLLNNKGEILNIDIGSSGPSEPFPGIGSFKAIAAGLGHGLALRENGTVVAWGRNDFGQASVPDGLTNVIAITAGYYFSAALKSDGHIVYWGSNDHGEHNTPAGVLFKAIAAGPHHMLGIEGVPSANPAPPLEIERNGDGVRVFTYPRLDGVFQLEESQDLNVWTPHDRFAIAGKVLNLILAPVGPPSSFYRLKKP